MKGEKYKMSKRIYISKKISDIEVSKVNPRFVQTVLLEENAIHKLIDLDLKSMEKLVESMIANGLDQPLFIALEQDDDTILMDGNRRLSALKILHDSSLIPQGKKYDKLRAICENNITLNIDEIQVELWPKDSDLDALFNRISRLHVENDGTKSEWTIMAQYRFAKKLNRAFQSWIKTFTYYIKDDEKIDEILFKKVDVFKRIFTNKAFKGKISEEGKILLENDKQIFDSVKEFGLKRKAVTRMDSTEIEKELQLIFESYKDNFPPSDIEKEELNVPNNQENENPNSSGHKPTKNGTSLLTKYRRLPNAVSKDSHMYFLPENFFVNEKCSSKLKTIITELKYLDVISFPYSSTMLLRAMYEMALQEYSKNTSSNYKYNECQLESSFNGALNDLKTSGLIGEKEYNIYKTVINKEKFVKILNNNIHDIIDSNTRFEISEINYKLIDVIKLLINH